MELSKVSPLEMKRIAVDINKTVIYSQTDCYFRNKVRTCSSVAIVIISLPKKDFEILTFGGNVFS